MSTITVRFFSLHSGVMCSELKYWGGKNRGGCHKFIGSVTFEMPIRYSHGDILKVVEQTSLH